MTKKLSIKMIETLAFIMPQYDHTAVNEYIPTVDKYSVGLCVMQWNHEDQCFEVGKEFDEWEYAEARAHARQRHEEIKRELGIVND